MPTDTEEYSEFGDNPEQYMPNQSFGDPMAMAYNQEDEIKKQEIKRKQLVADDSEKLAGKRIIPVPKPKTEIGIDTNDTVLEYIVGDSLTLDSSKLESFTAVSQQRETIMELLDTMAEDPTIGAVLNVYADDVTEPNMSGQVMWAESTDSDTAKYVQYLLDVMNVDKHLADWTRSLILYGDLYIKLFRESEVSDDLFDDKEKSAEERKKLNEAVYIYAADKKNDRYVHYVKAIKNPAEMFELTKFGKSYAYIQADVRQAMNKNYDSTFLNNTTFKYQFNKGDVTLYQPTEFVHAYLSSGNMRFPEEVEIFIENPETAGINDRLDQSEEKAKAKSLTYEVRRGQSLFYNTFKIWRIMMLLQNSMLLNRLTKSSVVRIIEVSVPEQSKEDTRKMMLQIKQMFEQKTAIKEGESLSEYTNPGPMENNIYVPRYGENGTISIQSVGGDTEVKGLGDVDYFRNLFFGSLGLPKEYFGFDENGGFDGGTSLSLKSSRYAKTVKRIQNALIQAMTDVINLILIDCGQQSRINKFKLRMQAPATVEENDRVEQRSNYIRNTKDFLDALDSLETPSTRLSIAKILLSPQITDPDTLTLIENEIDRLKELEKVALANEEMQAQAELGGFGGGMGGYDDFGGGGGFDLGPEIPPEEGGAQAGMDEGGGELPSPADLGAGDMSDANFEV